MPITGKDEVLANLDKIPKIVKSQVFTAMSMGLDETVNHIKTEYAWPKTHKGFTDRTTNLRNSIDDKVNIQRDTVVGYVHAGWGGQENYHYAYWVETRWEGKHAYLWPGCQDKKKDVFNYLKEIRINL